MARHPGSIDQHGPSWRVRLCVNGQRHTFMMPEGQTKEDAAQFAREKHAELHRQHGKALPGPTPFSDLLARYRTSDLTRLAPNSQKSYRTSLSAFSTYFVTQGGDPAAHEITKGHIKGFMTWRWNHGPDGTRLNRPVAARTVAKDRVVLHVLFAFAVELEIIEFNPVTKTKPPVGDEREPLILRPHEYDALLEACEGRPMLSLYMLTLGETGMRCDSEALWLRWEDVDLERGLVTIESARKGQRTKSGKSRKVPMTLRLREAIRDHMAAYRLRAYRGERTRWIFHHELDERGVKAGTRLGSLRGSFAAAVKRAGLPAELNQHDLRHRRVTTWLAEGKPAHIVQKAMGHSDLRTTLGYEHLVDDDLMQLVEAPAVRAIAK